MALMTAARGSLEILALVWYGMMSDCMNSNALLVNTHLCSEFACACTVPEYVIA